MNTFGDSEKKKQDLVTCVHSKFYPSSSVSQLQVWTRCQASGQMLLFSVAFLFGFTAHTDTHLVVVCAWTALQQDCSALQRLLRYTLPEGDDDETLLHFTFYFAEPGRLFGDIAALCPSDAAHWGRSNTPL